MPFDPHMDIAEALAANVRVVQHLLADLQRLTQPLQDAAELIRRALMGGHKVLCCGNGGGACEGAHFAAELAGRYRLDRAGYAAIDLTGEHAVLTALINDFAPEQAFARRVQALGVEGDVLVVFSTSGRSRNVRLALEMAASKQMCTVAFLGRDGGECKGRSTVELIVPSDNTARIQESHLLLCHTLCDVLDPILART